MATYVGLRDRLGTTIHRIDGATCRMIDDRLDLKRHSPTGLEWGYQGSGPAQTALALLCDSLEDDQAAIELYQRFKRDVVALLPKPGWVMESTAIEAWVIAKLGTTELADDQGEVIELGVIS